MATESTPREPEADPQVTAPSTEHPVSTRFNAAPTDRAGQSGDDGAVGESTFRAAWRHPSRAVRVLREDMHPTGLFPLAVLFGLNMVDEFDRVAFGALAPEIRDTFHLSNATFVAIVSMSGALSILLAVPIGNYADRSHRVGLARVAATVWMIAGVLTGLAPILAVLVVARFANGIGKLANEVVHPSLLADWYPPQHLPNVFALHRFANTVGLLVGPLAGLLGSVWGWRPTFVVLSIPTLAFVLLARRLEEPQRGLSLGLRADDDPVGMREGFRRMKAIGSMRRNWLCGFLAGSGLVSYAAFIALYFEEEFGAGPVLRGAITTCSGLGGALGLYVAGRLSKRTMLAGRPEGVPVVLGLLLIVFAVGMLLMGLSPWLGLSIALSFVMGLGAAGAVVAYQSTVALVAPVNLRSQAFSWSLIFFAIGGLLFSPIAGAIGDQAGLRAGLVVLSVCLAAGGYAATTERRFIVADMARRAGA